MKRLNIEEYRAEFEELFGKTLTVRQLWMLVKFGKNIRLRCRNNSALNNFLKSLFPYATFRQVPKTVPDWQRPGFTKVIEGLQITSHDQTVEDTDEAED